MTQAEDMADGGEEAPDVPRRQAWDRLSQGLGAIAALYADVDAAIAVQNPVCRASGRCCHFEPYGHQLYVTTMELAYFAHVQRPPGNRAAPLPHVGIHFFLPLYHTGDKPGLAHLRPPAGQGEVDNRDCPWQVEGLCAARQGRPLGCRIYFCDRDGVLWRQELYERSHRRLVELHREYAIPYRYLEWRQALEQLALPPGPAL